VPIEELFDWHARPGAFERLTPPWEPVEIVSRTGTGIEPGARVTLRMRAGPVAQRWVAEHDLLERPRVFRDVQVEGPFALWRHTHRCEPDGPGASRLEDHIEYALPLGALGRLFGGGFTRDKLERMFAYRHRVTAADLAQHARFRGEARQRVLLTGASGLVGRALGAFLTTGGHAVTPVRRKGDDGGEPLWDEASWADAGRGERPYSIIHLAGESLASGRLTAERKQRIWRSRVDGTRRLCEAIARLPRVPDAFLSASAIGYYGDRGDEPLDDSAPRGEGYLAELCEAWERASRPLAERGVRVVFLRLGVLLTPLGGALAAMLPAFSAGLGGPLGGGGQVVSWMALDDAVYAIGHALMRSDLAGPVNVVSPRPVTSREQARALGRVLGRPAALPAPAFALRAAMGELADEALLASARVVPKKLLECGLEPQYPDLDAALRHLLGRWP
jgi:uncharacterized protein (TIGR01777 family)